MHLAWQSSAVCAAGCGPILARISEDSGLGSRFAKLPKTEIPTKEEDE